jgi:hypothetical protein
MAAFHAATCAALLSMLLYQQQKATALRMGYIVLIVLLVGVVVLTGRRKMLMTLSLFWVAQFFLLSVLRRGVSRRLLMVLVVGLAVSVGFGVMSSGETSSSYVIRGTSVFGSVGERVGTSVMLFESALGRSSWLGLGAGTASQGMRYAGVDMFGYVGGSAESGIGYIAVELGIPGVLAILWLTATIALVMWRQLKRVAQISDTNLIQSVSYLSLLAANMATFATATQLYGDYFVLIILGVFAGGLYASIYDALNKQIMLRRFRLLLQQNLAGHGA